MASDLISRYALIRDMYEDGYFPLTVADKATEKVMAQPTVDAVEVVRCKDCKRSQHDRLYGGIWCDGHQVPKNHFCGYGAKMEGGEQND